MLNSSIEYKKKLRQKYWCNL